MTLDLRDRVLLVGATGSVGSMIFKCWEDRGENFELVPQVRSTKGLLNEVVWDPFEGSDNLARDISKHRTIKTMVILAGITPGSEKPLSLNSEIVEACLFAAFKVGIKRILVASSSAVYGINDGTPFRENSKTVPQNAYGKAKLKMETICHQWAQKGLNVCCLRIGNVAGADALMKNFETKKLNSPLKIDIFQDGKGPLRSYIGPFTMYKVLKKLSLSNNALPRILNLAAPIPMRMEDIANAAGHEWIARSCLDSGIQRITLDCSLISKLYKFTKKDSSPEEIIRQWEEQTR